MSKEASSWKRVFAGYYQRIGSDGKTILAQVGRDGDGSWSYTVRPFGEMSLAWQVTGFRTLAEAKTGAQAAYRSYMNKHRALNSK
ncbi:hypothetical protein ABZ154_09395 [Streptomyces sp. NPDC006261]|uniref:hypothetical protein n=1 Tax=Streptomyces sp. NPDC006261 TaxID=3156739 RepID=UPI0033AFEBA0